MTWAAAFAGIAAVSAVAGLTALVPRGVRIRLPFARALRVRVPELRRLKVVAAIVAAVLGAVVFSGSSLRAFVFLTGAATVAGFVAPDLWLTRQSRRRIDAALRDLPDMLDLLRVAIAAGAPPMRGLALVAVEFHGPLASEWRRVCALAELGVTQDEALAGLLERLPHDDMRAFVDTLRRGHRHGGSLAGTLAAQAARTRHAQAQRLRERAARAGPKIQLVVALVLVPSVLLLLAAGIMAELERGLGFAAS